MTQSSPKPGADAALVERLRARDPAAFRALVARHHLGFVRLARRFVASDAVAEEVVQEAWLAVIEGLDHFEGRARLSTWMFTIVANKAKTRGERERRSVPWSSLEANDEDGDPLEDRLTARGQWSAPPEAWPEESAEGIALRGELMGRITAEIEALPERLRLVVTLRDVHGLSADEVCNVLDVTETNQRVMLHRARTRLRAALEPHVGKR